ncbi:hypothetical protein ACRJ4B_19760 [Streptomyces sp. GTA36]
MRQADASFWVSTRWRLIRVSKTAHSIPQYWLWKYCGEHSAIITPTSAISATAPARRWPGAAWGPRAPLTHSPSCALSRYSRSAWKRLMAGQPSLRVQLV